MHCKFYLQSSSAHQRTVLRDIESAMAALVHSGCMKLAVTDLFESILTVHAPVPVHAPDHDPKVNPESGLAVTVTVWPDG